MKEKIAYFSHQLKHELVLHPFFFVLFYLIQSLNLLEADVINTEVWVGTFISLNLTVVFFAICQFIFRQKHFTGVFLTTSLFFTLYYSYFDSIVNVAYLPSVLGKHKFWYLFFIMLLGGIWWFAWKKRFKLQKLNFFLNTLTLIYCLVELYTFSFSQKQLVASNKALPCKDCPDVYLLILDAYSNPNTLEEYFGYDSQDFISYLKESQFFYVENAKSTYDHTVLTMNAMFNMDYIFDDLKMRGEDTEEQRKEMLKSQIEENELVHRFLMRGYQFHNISIFDIHGQPQINYYFTLSQNFVEFLFQRTVFYFTYKNTFALFDNNHRIVNRVTEVAKSPSETPKFVYGHLMLPHDPFIFDKDGNTIPLQDLDNTDAYIEQVKYTDKLAEKWIEDILESTQREAIIIVTGDHGYRGFGIYKDLYEDSTAINQTLTAIYFPNQEYSQLSDTLSSVNIFPAVLNNALGTNIPFKKDTINYFRE